MCVYAVSACVQRPFPPLHRCSRHKRGSAPWNFPLLLGASSAPAVPLASQFDPPPLTMAPVAQNVTETEATPNIEPVNALPPPVGPICLPRSKTGRCRGCPSLTKSDCPHTFVRPDLTSRCTWRSDDTRPVQDLSSMTQGPHSMQMPKKHEMGIMSSVLDAIGNTPMVRINRISKAANLQCDLCK